jgi:hypothetical protein
MFGPVPPQDTKTVSADGDDSSGTAVSLLLLLVLLLVLVLYFFKVLTERFLLLLLLLLKLLVIKDEIFVGFGVIAYLVFCPFGRRKQSSIGRTDACCCPGSL